jgi:terminase small subunit-like protein
LTDAYGISQRLPEVEEEILQRLAEGETLKAIVAELSTNDPSCRNLRTHHVRRWARIDLDFGLRYTQALEDGADALAEEAQQIADTPGKTELVTEKYDRKNKLIERHVRITDSLDRDKVRIMVRQWRAKSMNNRYRDRVGVGGLEGGDGTLTVKIEGGLPLAPPLVAPDKTADKIPILPVENPVSDT